MVKTLMKQCFTRFFTTKRVDVYSLYEGFDSYPYRYSIPGILPRIGAENLFDHLRLRGINHVIYRGMNQRFSSDNPQRIVLGGALRSINVLPSGKHRKKRWKITRF